MFCPASNWLNSGLNPLGLIPKSPHQAAFTSSHLLAVLPPPPTSLFPLSCRDLGG